MEMRMWKKWIGPLMIVLVLVLALAGCVGNGGDSKSKEGENSDTSLQEIKDSGKLILGCDDEFPPMGFDDNGEIKGFDIDLAKAVAEKLGVELEAKPIDWSNKELELQNKKIDVIWNGYTINGDRNKQVEFTRPYLRNTQRLVVKADSPVRSKEDLAGKVVGVQIDSAAEEIVKADAAFTDSLKELKIYNTYQEAMLDLKSSDRVDAVGGDKILLDYVMTQEQGAFRLLDDELASEYYGIGCRKGAVALREAIDEALDQLQADGALDAISSRWFGSNVVVRDVEKLTDKDFQEAS